MKKLFSAYKLHFSDKEFLVAFFSSFILLTIGVIVNFYAGVYATERASNSVTDIILSNIRVYDVDAFFIYGTFLFWFFVTFLCFLYPKKIPFTLKSISLFIFIRSIFITLTHIGPYPTKLLIESNILARFSFGGDLFFSGHTGLPFLMALIFWKDRGLRILFIASALFFGLIVLLGHLHYSIDVFAAFFITYSIFYIAERFFKKDRKIFFAE